MKLRGSYEVIEAETKTRQKKQKPTRSKSSSNVNFLLCFIFLVVVAVAVTIPTVDGLKAIKDYKSSSSIVTPGELQFVSDNSSDIVTINTISRSIEPVSGSLLSLNINHIVKEKSDDNLEVPGQPLHTKMMDIGDPSTEPEYRYELSDEERTILEKVVEAEVGSSFNYNGEKVSEEEILKSKIRVAQVFYNRVEDESKFSCIDNMKESLLYPGATSTIGNGSYYKVKVTELTKEAVELALLETTEDYSKGALFFHSGSSTSSPYGNYLFTDSVGHKFFK